MSPVTPAISETIVEPPSYQYQLEDVNQGIVDLLSSARRGTVLDVGCGRGRLGAELGDMGFEVTGIESNPEACVTAATRLRDVIEADCTDFDAMSDALGNRRFDYLMAADVFEHLVDPVEALRFYRQFLADDGRLVLSLPNAAVWDNRLRILAGRFTYKDSGVMDRTHLRFFTFRTARQFVEACGFVPTETSFEPGIARAFLPLVKKRMSRQEGIADPGAMLDSPAFQAYARYVLPVERAITRLDKGFFAFRVVLLAEQA
jgi:2-polyprenyl-3-methyl-5-hydroxy-6-metoxy-1,4-benzoquinol methylase